jgi:hypothetical protein
VGLEPVAAAPRGRGRRVRRCVVTFVFE